MMPSDLITQIQPQPSRLRFSVDDYYKMIELGILKDYEKAEIIEGELIKKMTIGDRHAMAVNFLNRYLSRSVSENVLVSVQNPLRLTDFDEPEPDFVLADLTKYDAKRHPRPKDVLLVIEVSDVSLRYDRNTKLPLYAEAEIPEVWIVNLQKDVIEVHQNPAAGIYLLTTLFKKGDRVISSVLPEIDLEVGSILS